MESLLGTPVARDLAECSAQPPPPTCPLKQPSHFNTPRNGFAWMSGVKQRPPQFARQATVRIEVVVSIYRWGLHLSGHHILNRCDPSCTS